jgi:hypothetical protein
MMAKGKIGEASGGDGQGIGGMIERKGFKCGDREEAS